MKPNKCIKNFLAQISKAVEQVDSITLDRISCIIQDVNNSGKKVIVVGNGGSAAISSHVAVDLTKAAKVRAVNFNEADLITCYANDYGYDQWVSRALDSYPTRVMLHC